MTFKIIGYLCKWCSNLTKVKSCISCKAYNRKFSKGFWFRKERCKHMVHGPNLINQLIFSQTHANDEMKK